jgi:hypothetical protein
MPSSLPRTSEREAVNGVLGPASPTLILLAAGLGSRYGGLKQLAPVGPGGSTLMDYSLYDGWRAGFRRAVFVIRPELAEEFASRVAPRYAGRLEVILAEQRLEDLPAWFRRGEGRTRPWGTTQAVLAAAPSVTGDFLVLNADDSYGPLALEAAGAFLHDPGATGYAVVGFRLDHTLSASGGVNRAMLEVGSDGALQGVAEVRDVVRTSTGTCTGRIGDARIEVTGDTLVSMNLWALRATIIPSLTGTFERFLRGGPGADAECPLPDAMEEAMRRGEAAVTVLPTASRWCGVTYPGDREWVSRTLELAVRQGLYPEQPWP